MAPYLQKFYDIILLARPFNSLQPLVLFVFGVVISGGDVRHYSIYVGLLGLFLLHSAMTIWNDLNDQAVDRRNNVKTVLTQGYISEKSLQYIVLSLSSVGILLCIFFLPPISALLAVLIVLFGWQYSAKPLRASHHPVGSMVFLALTYGAAPLLLGATLGQFHQNVWLFAGAWSLARVSLSLLKDYKDAVGDAKEHKKTFLLRFGHKRVVAVSVICALLGYGGVLMLTTQFVYPEYRLGLVGLGIALIGVLIFERIRLLAASTYQAQHDLFREIGYIQLGIDGALTAWLILLAIS